MRLHLLQGILAYHQNKNDEAMTLILRVYSYITGTHKIQITKLVINCS